MYSSKRKNPRQLFGAPAKLIPNYKIQEYGQCSCPPNGNYCDCAPEYKPRNKGKCGMRRIKFPTPQNDEYYIKDDSWKYGYFAHRLSDAGPGASWKNGVGEVAIYGVKNGLQQQDREITSVPLFNQYNLPNSKKEGFGLAYGAGNEWEYNHPEDYDHSCGFKPYMLYG